MIIYDYIWLYMNMIIYIILYIFKKLYIDIRVYIYTYIYMYMHTYIYIDTYYIHTVICVYIGDDHNPWIGQSNQATGIKGQRRVLKTSVFFFVIFWWSDWMKGKSAGISYIHIFVSTVKRTRQFHVNFPLNPSNKIPKIHSSYQYQWMW
jgi:hypothetical protein